MPAKAKAMMDGIITISQDAVFKLETEPNGTIEYVKLLSFLDEIQEKVCTRASDYIHICTCTCIYQSVQFTIQVTIT